MSQRVALPGPNRSQVVRAERPGRSSRRLFAVPAALACALVWLALPVAASALGPNDDIWTDSQFNLRLDGPQGGAEITSTSRAGDFNGDGKGDVIVGTAFYDFSGRGDDTGAAYVIYGRTAPAGTVQDIAAIDAAGGSSSVGFRILGEAGGDNVGSTVGGGRDVNGDGRPDVVVGGYDAGTSDRGAAYVVFGANCGTTCPQVDLLTFGAGSTRGFRIQQSDTRTEQFGASVSLAADMNGDGRAEVVAGDPAYDGGTGASCCNRGGAWVAFGRTTNLNFTEPVAAGTGFRIDGATPDDNAGRSVGGGNGASGDVNGDGLGDVIVGSVNYDEQPFGCCPKYGAAHVVFGKSSNATVSLNYATFTAANSGIAILGRTPPGIGGTDNNFGQSVDILGDHNGDGRSDVAAGARLLDTKGDNGGAVFVVYGRTAGTVDMASPPAGYGYRIDGRAANDQLGYSLGAAGDVNGDGLGDLIAGAPYEDSHSQSNNGAAYVVFGSASTTNIDVASTANGNRFFRITGDSSDDRLGSTDDEDVDPATDHQVYGAGDFNGDGRADVIAAAHGDDTAGRTNNGAAYILFGPQVDYGAPSCARRSPCTINPTVPPVVGTTSFSLTGTLPPGMSFNSTTGVISGTPTEEGTYTVTVTYNTVEGPASDTFTITITEALCTITGTPGPDVLNGTAGDDVICGRGGNDTIRGEAGNDILRGEDGNDVLDGNAGSDEFLGGAGTDRVSYASRVSAVTVTIGAGTDDDGSAGEGDDVQGDVEDLRGGSADDQLTGDDDANLLLGEGGNDFVNGLGGPDDLRGDSSNAQVGDDVVVGGSGNDALRGYAGADQHFGEAGNDTIYSDAGADSLSGGDGIDSAYYAGRTGDLAVTVGAGAADDGGAGEGDNVDGDVEKVSGGSGNDELTGNANPLGTVLLGGSGNDTLNGGGGPKDLLAGDAGDDSLDTLDGDSSDTLSCGAGTDTNINDSGDAVNADCEGPPPLA